MVLLLTRAEANVVISLPGPQASLSHILKQNTPVTTPSTKWWFVGLKYKDFQKHLRQEK